MVLDPEYSAVGDNAAKRVVDRMESRVRKPLAASTARTITKREESKSRKRREVGAGV